MELTTATFAEYLYGMARQKLLSVCLHLQQQQSYYITSINGTLVTFPRNIFTFFYIFSFFSNDMTEEGLLKAISYCIVGITIIVFTSTR